MGGTQYSICDTVFHESLQWIRNICFDDQLKGIRLLSHTNRQGVQLHPCRSKWDAQLDVFVWIWPFVGRFFRNVAGKCQNLRWIRTFAANLSCQHSTRGGWGKEKATSTYRGHTGAEFYRRALFLMLQLSWENLQSLHITGSKFYMLKPPDRLFFQCRKTGSCVGWRRSNSVHKTLLKQPSHRCTWTTQPMLNKCSWALGMFCESWSFSISNVVWVSQLRYLSTQNLATWRNCDGLFFAPRIFVKRCNHLVIFCRSF